MTPMKVDDLLLRKVHPVVRPPVCTLVNRVALELGISLRVFDTYRDGVAQDAAFAAGASKKKAGQSWHNLTLADGTPAAFAVHVGVELPTLGLIGFGKSLLEPPGAVRVWADVWDNKVGTRLTAEQLVLAAVGLKAEEIGFVAGMRWRMLQDWCHVEWHPNGAPLEEVRAVLAAQGTIGGLRT